uniref:Ankyrin repeat and SOCS box containing 2b n=1 Tax=Neogobius melanostomus TaxID=47308 RepID=A0A8C6T3D4_9GOBI
PFWLSFQLSNCFHCDVFPANSTILVYERLPPNTTPSTDDDLKSFSIALVNSFLLVRARSSLQSVIELGDVEALKDLLLRDSPITPDADGWSPLHLSANCGQTSCVQLLLSAHPDLLNRRTPKGTTALMFAVRRGHASCAELLLNHGADPDIANTNRDTALHFACEQRDEPLVALLLRSGAKVNRSCSFGNSALYRNVFGIDPLFMAAQNGHSSLALIKFNLVNTQALDGASPLFEASRNGHESVVELLLSLKADANRSNKSGLLHLVSLLLPFTSRGCVQRSGISPLHLAAERDHEAVLEQLITAGFDVNAPLSEERSRNYSDHRSSALFFSVHSGNLRTARVLLEAGADTEQDVFCPLLVAVRMGWVDLTALLLQYRANVHTQPSSFAPALHLGLESLPTLKLLLDNGCDAEACFHCRYSPNPHHHLHQNATREELRRELLQLSDQFCEAVSRPSLCHLTGPIVTLLLDYVDMCSSARSWWRCYSPAACGCKMSVCACCF